LQQKVRTSGSEEQSPQKWTSSSHPWLRTILWTTPI